MSKRLKLLVILTERSMNMVQEPQGMEFKELISIIFRKWWLIGLLFIVCIGTAYLVTAKLIDPIYESETSLFLGKEQGEIAGFDISLSDLQVSSQLITDYRELSNTRMIIEQVINDLGLNMDVKTFQKNLSVDVIADSRLFTVKFQHKDPKLAADIANAVAEQLALIVTEIVEVQNIRVIDEALIPKEPIKPSKLMNTAIAGILGIMLALFIILLLDYLDSTIKDENDINKEFGLTVIGVIPAFKGESR